MRTRTRLSLPAILGLLLAAPGPAAATWGSDDWGSMIWGGVPAVPLIPWVGLVGLSLAIFLAALHLQRGTQGAGRSVRRALFIAVLVAPLGVAAATLVTPNTFVNGTVADADEVNSNFTAVEVAVNDNDTRITTIEDATQLDLGTNDAVAGGIQLFGDSAFAGGALDLFNAASEDVVTDSWSLEADSSFKIRGDGTESMSLTETGNMTIAGTLTQNSDARLKQDLEPLRGALEKVQAIRGLTYRRLGADEREAGVLAQEVQAVLPEVVRIVDTRSGLLGVSYTSLVPLLIEAIKEERAEREVLARESHGLKLKLARIEERLAALDNYSE